MFVFDIRSMDTSLTDRSDLFPVSKILHIKQEQKQSNCLQSSYFLNPIKRAHFSKQM